MEERKEQRKLSIRKSKALRIKEELADVFESYEQDPELRLMREALPIVRPKTRSECFDWDRPCAFAGCPYHLYLDVNPVTGFIKFNFPGKEVWEIGPTCSLDYAPEGMTLEDVGAKFQITRERVRQIAEFALKKLRKNQRSKELREDLRD